MKGWLNLITFLTFGTQHLSEMALWWLTEWERTRRKIYCIPPSRSSYPVLQQQVGSWPCTAPRAGFKKDLHHAQKSKPRQSRWLWQSMDQGLNRKRYHLWLSRWTSCLNAATKKAGGALCLQPTSPVLPTVAWGSCSEESCRLRSFCSLSKCCMTVVTACVTQPLRATGARHPAWEQPVLHSSLDHDSRWQGFLFTHLAFYMVNI